jgi:hypothetical protein
MNIRYIVYKFNERVGTNDIHDIIEVPLHTKSGKGISSAASTWLGHFAHEYSDRDKYTIKIEFVEV